MKGGGQPIIVGVGDVKDPFVGVDAAEEPLYLILQAIHAAARDTKLSPYSSENLLSEVDSIDVVRIWTWTYDDLAGDLAKEIRTNPGRKATTLRHGGDQPAKLIDEAARRIAVGKSKVALVAGGEALASLSAHMAAKGSPPPHWTKTRDGLESIFADERQRDKNSLGGKHGINAPIQVYPLYENAMRAHQGQTIPLNHAESTQMYEALVETYTVDFAKDGKPLLGHVVGRLIHSGKRFLANHGSEKTLMELASKTREPIGRLGTVKVGDAGKNIFCFEEERPTMKIQEAKI